MASPVPIIEEAVKTAGGWQKLPLVIQQAMEIAAKASVEEFVVAEGGVVTVADEAAAGSLFSIWGWIVFFGVAAAIVVLYTMEQILLGLAGVLPGQFGIQGHATSFVHWVFGPLDALLNLLNSWATTLAKDTVHGWIDWLDWILPHTHTIESLRAAGSTGSGAGASAQMLAEIVGQLLYQQGEIAALQAAIALPGAVPVAPPSTFPTQIHQMQAELQNLNQRVTALEGTASGHTTTLTQLGTDLLAIQAELHGIRASTSTLPEIETGIQVQIAAVNSQLVALQAESLVQTAAIHDLSPLMLLVLAGAAGLENLRKLEDNICQCPHFPGIPNELGAALAGWLLVKSGP
jgi:hypothetical protein